MRGWFVKSQNPAGGLEAALKVSRPDAEVPADLHGSIMRSVRALARKSPCPKPLHGAELIPRWVWSSAFGLLVLVFGWWFYGSSTGGDGRRPGRETGSTALVDARDFLQLGERAAHDSPAAALAPLSREMEFLKQDAQRAAEFLMASLP